jgi:hypothetical protein
MIKRKNKLQTRYSTKTRLLLLKRAKKNWNEDTITLLRLRDDKIIIKSNTYIHGDTKLLFEGYPTRKKKI